MVLFPNKNIANNSAKNPNPGNNHSIGSNAVDQLASSTLNNYIPTSSGYTLIEMLVLSLQKTFSVFLPFMRCWSTLLWEMALFHSLS
jgi:hypothetical protein